MRSLLALLFSLALATPAWADCGWVLWTTTNSPNSNVLIPPPGSARQQG